jgi:hypothetical protein
MNFGRQAHSRVLFFSTLRGALLLVLALVVASCGGGSADYADSVSIDSLTYSPSAPQSGSPVSATGAVTVALGSSSTSGSVSYLWTQTSGPAVTLSGTTSSTVYFTAPTVTTSTAVVLNLTVTLNSVTASQNVTVTIAP